MPSFKTKNGSIILDTGTLLRRILLTGIILALVSPAVYRSYRIFRADRIVRTEQTFESYSRALQYDPGNATLWWQRGRLRHYSAKTVDLPQAISDYRMALSLNLRLSQAWLDLSDCYERTGKYEDAEAALNNALSTHTYSSVTRWQAGNFFLRRGNLPRMYDCFKTAIEYDPGKLGIAADTAWKVDADHSDILQKLVPDSLPENLQYFDFLVSREELDLAQAAWERALKNEVPRKSEFKVSTSFRYIDRLLARNRVEEAQVVWDEALRKSGSGLRDTRIMAKEPGPGVSGPLNLVWNGSFENVILRGGLDWRFPDLQDVKLEADLTNCMDGLKCLRTTFGGTNIRFSHLSQIIPVPGPGNYVLDLCFRTEGLTTDQRPYVSIQGYPEASGASLRTGQFPESTSWRKKSYPFAINKTCKAVQFILRRDPSSKFDNQIKGSLWLDGISIHAESASAAAATGSSAAAERREHVKREDSGTPILQPTKSMPFQNARVYLFHGMS
jgi:tetratricopeptide (TPR) repeat protein